MLKTLCLLLTHVASETEGQPHHSRLLKAMNQSGVLHCLLTCVAHSFVGHKPQPRHLEARRAESQADTGGLRRGEKCLFDAVAWLELKSVSLQIMLLISSSCSKISSSQHCLLKEWILTGSSRALLLLLRRSTLVHDKLYCLKMFFFVTQGLYISHRRSIAATLVSIKEEGTQMRASAFDPVEVNQKFLSLSLLIDEFLMRAKAQYELVFHLISFLRTSADLDLNYLCLKVLSNITKVDLVASASQARVLSPGVARATETGSEVDQALIATLNKLGSSLTVSDVTAVQGTALQGVLLGQLLKDLSQCRLRSFSLVSLQLLAAIALARGASQIIACSQYDNLNANRCISPDKESEVRKIMLLFLYVSIGSVSEEAKNGSSFSVNRLLKALTYLDAGEQKLFSTKPTTRVFSTRSGPGITVALEQCLQASLWWLFTEELRSYGRPEPDQGPVESVIRTWLRRGGSTWLVSWVQTEDSKDESSEERGNLSPSQLVRLLLACHLLLETFEHKVPNAVEATNQNHDLVWLLYRKLTTVAKVASQGFAVSSETATRSKDNAGYREMILFTLLKLLTSLRKLHRTVSSIMLSATILQKLDYEPAFALHYFLCNVSLQKLDLALRAPVMGLITASIEYFRSLSLLLKPEERFLTDFNLRNSLSPKIPRTKLSTILDQLENSQSQVTDLHIDSTTLLSFKFPCLRTNGKTYKEVVNNTLKVLFSGLLCFGEMGTAHARISIPADATGTASLLRILDVFFQALGHILCAKCYVELLLEREHRRHLKQTIRLVCRLFNLYPPTAIKSSVPHVFYFLASLSRVDSLAIRVIESGILKNTVGLVAYRHQFAEEAECSIGHASLLLTRFLPTLCRSQTVALFISMKQEIRSLMKRKIGKQHSYLSLFGCSFLLATILECYEFPEDMTCDSEVAVSLGETQQLLVLSLEGLLDERNSVGCPGTEVLLKSAALYQTLRSFHFLHSVTKVCQLTFNPVLIEDLRRSLNRLINSTDVERPTALSDSTTVCNKVDLMHSCGRKATVEELSIALLDTLTD